MPVCRRRRRGCPDAPRPRLQPRSHNEALPNCANLGSTKAWLPPAMRKTRRPVRPTAQTLAYCRPRRRSPPWRAIGTATVASHRFALARAAVSSRIALSPDRRHKKLKQDLALRAQQRAWIAGRSPSRSMSLVMRPCSSFLASSPATRTMPRSASSAMFAGLMETCCLLQPQWCCRLVFSQTGKRAGAQASLALVVPPGREHAHAPASAPTRVWHQATTRPTPGRPPGHPSPGPGQAAGSRARPLGRLRTVLSTCWRAAGRRHRFAGRGHRPCCATTLSSSGGNRCTTVDLRTTCPHDWQDRRCGH